MIRLLFFIGALNRGGAERQLALLAKEIDQTRFAVTVVTAVDGGSLRPEIEAVGGIDILSLRKRGHWDILRPVWRLIRILWRIRPHIVHGYMNSANVLILPVGKLAGAKVVWGLRASNVDFSLYGRRASLMFHLAAWLSRFPDLIVVNSEAGLKHHIAHGFSRERMLVIPNGFDTEQFQPDGEARRRMRQAWGVPESDFLIGLVARLDPIKDHQSFLRAAALLAAQRADVRFVIVGDGPEPYRRELTLLADRLGLRNRIIWSGELNDMRGVSNALDVATSSSTSEGFSNTIGEAMACGVPCVVTDVGDSALLVGNTGGVVSPGAPDEMVRAWMHYLQMSHTERIAAGQAARERIISHYSSPKLARRTEAALKSLLVQVGSLKHYQEDLK